MGGSERSADDPLAAHNWTIWARPSGSRDACARCMPNSDVLIASVKVGGRSCPVCGTAATQPPMQRACGSSSAQAGNATGSCPSAGIAVPARPPGGLAFARVEPPAAPKTLPDWCFRVSGLAGRRPACRGCPQSIARSYGPVRHAISGLTWCFAGLAWWCSGYVKVSGIAVPMRLNASRWTLVGSAVMICSNCSTAGDGGDCTGQPASRRGRPRSYPPELLGHGGPAAAAGLESGRGPGSRCRGERP